MALKFHTTASRESSPRPFLNAAQGSEHHLQIKEQIYTVLKRMMEQIHNYQQMYSLFLSNIIYYYQKRVIFIFIVRTMSDRSAVLYCP